MIVRIIWWLITQLTTPTSTYFAYSTNSSFDEIETPKPNNKPIVDQMKPSDSAKPATKEDKFEIESDNDSLDFN